MNRTGQGATPPDREDHLTQHKPAASAANMNDQPAHYAVTVEVTVPKHLSADERDLFEQLSEASSFNPREARK